ncbi:microtubule-associated protein [Trypanosoma grayi]|uniref:microtubule-associated protein n=1 Tax=Trypanosoma grayi TaxID=71804 RepID=UPI0004F4BBE0|nr:microtubule-associated protein [Trypanosoma grayi]KEG14014.1 microtubule-associated protein [Trypanosoma grayi]
MDGFTRMRKGKLHSEYEDSFQFRGRSKDELRRAPASHKQKTQQPYTPQNSACKPIDPSMYKREEPEEDEEEVGPRHVDPDHFRSTAQEAYKPIDPAEYKRDQPEEDEEEAGPRHVDPDHFRSTAQESYKPIDPSAYKRDGSLPKDEEVKVRRTDPSAYKSVSQESFKPIDASAYKRDQPKEDEEVVGPRHVDPDHFRSTVQESYKPIDPSAYKREQPEEDEEEVGPRHVDPDHFRSTAQEAYKPIDPGAYKREQEEKTEGDASSRVPPFKVPPRRSNRNVLGSGRSCLPTERRDGVPMTGRSSVGKGSQTARSVVPFSARSSASQPYEAKKLPESKAPGAGGYMCPCHADPDFYSSTTHADFKAHNVVPKIEPKRGSVPKDKVLENRTFASEYKSRFLRPEPQALPRPVVSAPVKVRHMDPSMYTTTNKAVFCDHWKDQ